MKRRLRSFLIIIISNCLAFLPLVNIKAAENLALPSGDVIAPEIKHTPNTSLVPAGEFINIHATVTDNVGVKDVTIFYRDKISTGEYKRTKMTREQGTDFYSAALPGVMAPGVEYYLQATDLAGNTILHGHTFSPLSITMTPGAPAQEGAGERTMALQDDVAEPANKGINKWVWIGLGVLAVAGLAGSDSGDPDPTTGTIVITGSTPAP